MIDEVREEGRGQITNRWENPAWNFRLQLVGGGKCSDGQFLFKSSLWWQTEWQIGLKQGNTDARRTVRQ